VSNAPIGFLQQCRSVATRFEQGYQMLPAMIKLASNQLYLRKSDSVRHYRKARPISPALNDAETQTKVLGYVAAPFIKAMQTAPYPKNRNGHR